MKLWNSPGLTEVPNTGVRVSHMQIYFLEMSTMLQHELFAFIKSEDTDSISLMSPECFECAISPQAMKMEVIIPFWLKWGVGTQQTAGKLNHTPLAGYYTTHANHTNHLCVW